MSKQKCPICEKDCEIKIDYCNFWGGLVECEIRYICNNCGGIHWAYGNYSDYFKPRWWQFKRKNNLKKLIGVKPFYLWEKKFKKENK